MLEVLLALNLNVPDCPNYWVNPNTFKTECLYSNGGMLTNTPPRSQLELITQDDRAAFYIDRSKLEWSGRTVEFPLMSRYFQPRNGVIGLNIGMRVDCSRQMFTNTYVAIVGRQGVTKTIVAARTPAPTGNSNAFTDALISKVCK
jgi:hypothetical protein